MTTVVQDEIDFDAIDAEYQARVELVAGDWLKGDEDLAKFVAVLMDSRRGPLDVISQNDVRTKMLEETVRGPRMAINPNRYSALWSRACKLGVIRKHVNDEGRVQKDICKTSPTGNNGKEQTLYRWIGATE